MTRAASVEFAKYQGLGNDFILVRCHICATSSIYCILFTSVEAARSAVVLRRCILHSQDVPLHFYTQVMESCAGRQQASEGAGDYVRAGQTDV